MSGCQLKIASWLRMEVHVHFGGKYFNIHSLQMFAVLGEYLYELAVAYHRLNCLG